MKRHEPEMGQAIFGQPYKQFEVPEIMLAALESIRAELDRVMWNIHQKQYSSPFGNTGNSFVCDLFEVYAYSWDDEVPPPYNFRWKNLDISWYKYLGRGTSSNTEIEPELTSEMLIDCLKAVRKLDPPL